MLDDLRLSVARFYLQIRGTLPKLPRGQLPCFSDRPSHEVKRAMPLVPGFDRKLTRRSIFFRAGASLVCAPAIVRAASLMPVRRLTWLTWPDEPMSAGLCERLFYRSLDNDLRAGRMTTVHNGRTVSVVDAQRLVGRARVRGWIRGSQLQILAYQRSPVARFCPPRITGQF